MKKVFSLFISICVIVGLVSTTMFEVYAKTALPSPTISEIVGGDKSFTVKWEKAGKNASYQIQYAAGSFKKGKIKTVNIKKNATTSKTIKKLANNKKYKVRIRTYKVSGKIKTYSAWSKVKTVKTIKVIKLKKITVTPKSKKLEVGKQLQLTSKLTPSNATYHDIIYTSSNPAVATVSETGLVSAKSGGTVNITAKVNNTKISQSVKITVTVPTTGIKITTAKGLQVEKGKTLKLSATVSPANASNKKINWTTSDKTKATVDKNGVVTALIPTEYVLITATSAYNKKLVATYELQITDNSGFLTKQTLDSLNLLTTDNLMIVAHPDDETFWGGAHLFNSDYLENTEPFKSSGTSLNSNYLVVVMTNAWSKVRSDDLQRVMEATNDKFLILSYPDVRKSWRTSDKKIKYEADNWTTCKTGAQKDIELLLSYKKWDVVVTHNPDGEYSKSHHKIVNNIVSTVYNSEKLNKLNKDTPLFYFGHYYTPKQTIPGLQISEEDAAVKDQLVAMYSKLVSNSVKSFGHMFHYENWIWSENWEESKANKFNPDYFLPSEDGITGGIEENADDGSDNSSEDSSAGSSDNNSNGNANENSNGNSGNSNSNFNGNNQ